MMATWVGGPMDGERISLPLRDGFYTASVIIGDNDIQRWRWPVDVYRGRLIINWYRAVRLDGGSRPFHPGDVD